MSTARQKAANQSNAQKSTGPITPEGKRRACINHLSHGFASSMTLLPTENPEDFKALLIDLALEHEPVTPTEQILLEKMAQSQWLSNRAFRLQTEAFLANALAGEKFALPQDLPLLIRYKTAADNAFHKAHNELVKAKKQRPNHEIGFEPQTTLEALPQHADPAPEPPKTVSITVKSPTTPPDFHFTPQELDFELCPEAREFLKTSA